MNALGRTDSGVLEMMRGSFVHMLRRAIMLVNFVGLNVVGFEKIAKNVAKRSCNFGEYNAHATHASKFKVQLASVIEPQTMI